MSLYNPENSLYVHREKRKVRDGWNNFTYTAFVYNCNYPEILRSALWDRGCWDVLNYQELTEQVQGRKVKSGSKKQDLSQVDEAVIDRCHFLWRPVNFSEPT